MNQPIPIHHDATEAERRFAELAYTTYHRGRLVRPWEQLNAHEQFRWLMVAQAFVSFPNATARGLRSVYHLQIYVASWEDVGAIYRRRWEDVLTMLKAERIRMRSAAVMVVSA